MHHPIKDDFDIASLSKGIADDVEILIKRPKGAKKFPENLIQEYFRESQDKKKGKIKKIVVRGSNESGRMGTAKQS